MARSGASCCERSISQWGFQRLSRRTVERRMRACNAGRARWRLVIAHHSLSTLLADDRYCSHYRSQHEHDYDDPVNGFVHGDWSASLNENKPALSQLVPCFYGLIEARPAARKVAGSMPARHSEVRCNG